MFLMVKRGSYMFKKYLFLILSLFMINTVFANTVKLNKFSNLTNIEKQIYCLAEAIFFEARGESVTGQEAVGNVILNRTDVKVFPSNVCEVISQKGQFQWYANKSLRKGRVFKPKENEDIMKLSRTLYMRHLFGLRNDSTKNSLFFSSNGVRPSRNIVRSVKVGRHQFYRLSDKYKTRYL
jgi:spore germination cell wall hydrolase CwlJ-like protein